MWKSQNLPIDRAATLLVAVGGEPVAGSRFEAEEPEPDFAADERSEDEVRRTPRNERGQTLCPTQPLNERLNSRLPANQQYETFGKK